MKYEVKKLENKNMALTLDFDHEEWENVTVPILEIMLFFYIDAGRTEIEVTDYNHYAIYRLVTIVFMEESIDF